MIGTDVLPGRTTKVKGHCVGCRHERTIVAHGRCSACDHRCRRHGAVGNQTVQPSLLLSGDVIPWRGNRLKVTWVGLQLCEIAPKVRVRAVDLLAGDGHNLLFAADAYVPVEVSHA